MRTFGLALGLAAFAAIPMTAAGAAEFETVPVMVESSQAVSTVSGTVVPYKEVTLAAQVPGRIEFIAGTEGDEFATNTVLLSIDDDDLQARRRAAVAEIMSAQSALTNARVQYSRELVSPRMNNGMSQGSGMGLPAMFDTMFSRPLSSTMGMSNPGAQRYADLHGQASGVSQAQSRLLSAQARLEELDTNIRDARQIAPFDGVIAQKLVEVGDPVQPGQPLIKFVYIEYLRIKAEIPVRLVQSLEKGMFVPARLDVGGGHEVMARVSQIFPIADQNQHTVTVKFDLPKGVPGGAGMYAELRLPDTGSEAQALAVIPASSVVRRGSLPSVYVLVNGRPSLRLVRLGDPVGEDRIAVLSGLKSGEAVLVRPAQALGANQVVKQAQSTE